MILTHFTEDGLRRVADLQGVFKNQTALLVGGAPSLRDQPISLLNKRGVLTLAMNNAAIHFQPTMWISGDNPECYEPQIILDPSIMKFAPLAQAEVDIFGNKYHQVPNIFFYIQEYNVPWDEYLGLRRNVPWYRNTLLSGICVLYQLGIRRIILAGSDFEVDGSKLYAHETDLNSVERNWNIQLYTSLINELKLLKPVFERAGLCFMDCSVYSKLADVYEYVTLERAVQLCRESFPEKMKDSKDLPHCSKFAPDWLKRKVSEAANMLYVNGAFPIALDESNNKE